MLNLAASKVFMAWPSTSAALRWHLFLKDLRTGVTLATEVVVDSQVALGEDLLSLENRAEAQRIGNRACFLETAANKDFQDEFVQALRFPHSTVEFPQLVDVLPQVTDAMPLHRTRRDQSKS